MDLYEKTGAVLVISNEKPRGATTGAWIELGIQDNVPFYKDKADYYVFLLPAIGQSRPVTHIDGEFL